MGKCNSLVCRDERDTLRAEVEDLGNRLHHVHRLWANNEHSLRAENERLRAALEEIAGYRMKARSDADIARTALEEKP